MLPFPYNSANNLATNYENKGDIIGVNYVNIAVAASAATSLARTTMASIQNDDGLFAMVMARSAVTPPSGWSLVAQGISQTESGVTQTAYLYRKNVVTSANSSTSYTWSWASAGRGAVGYLQCRSPNKLHSITNITTRSDNGVASSSVPIAGITVGAYGSLHLSMVSMIIINSGSISISPPAGHFLLGAAAQTDARLLASITAPNNVGNVISGNFTAGALTQFSTGLSVIISAG